MISVDKNYKKKNILGGAVEIRKNNNFQFFSFAGRMREARNCKRERSVTFD
jgi:hypothetical protein